VKYGCDTCHNIPGVLTATATVGPPLSQIALRSYLAGRIDNTPENMIKWIRQPHSVDPQTAMPETGVTERVMAGTSRPISTRSGRQASDLQTAYAGGRAMALRVRSRAGQSQPQQSTPTHTAPLILTVTAGRARDDGGRTRVAGSRPHHIRRLLRLQRHPALHGSRNAHRVREEQGRPVADPRRAWTQAR
jgi:hypothetical protein